MLSAGVFMSSTVPYPEDFSVLVDGEAVIDGITEVHLEPFLTGVQKHSGKGVPGGRGTQEGSSTAGLEVGACDSYPFFGGSRV